MSRREPYIAKPQQNLDELREFVAWIREQNIKSYLEIGAKSGGLLWHVAQAMPPASRLVALDLPHGPWGRNETEQQLRHCVAELQGQGHDVKLFIGDSTAPHIAIAIREFAPFDCVFIDANHTEGYVRRDFANYGRLGKYCCFHDIGWNNPTPPGRLPIDVPKVWNELKAGLAAQAAFREIKRDRNHNGIGILEWR